MDKKPKTITLLISHLGGGGAENVCVSVANGLVEKGWEVNLLVLHSENANYANRLSSEVNLIELGVKHTRQSLFLFRKFLAEHKPNKILAFNYEMTLLSILSRIFFRQQFKLIARNINTMSEKRKEPKKKNFWRKYIISPLSRNLYDKIDFSINQCYAMESDLLRVYPNLKGKTCVIYNPISEHIVNYQQGEKKRKENYLLCVGRLVRQKNFSHAIQAFSIYSKKNPDCQLKIIGTGDQEDALKKLAKKLEIEDKVQFLGFKQDVRPYYLKAKATILSSNYEGFPNVLLESIALGTPVVAYDCPSGPAEIIQEGVNGFLVEHLNIKALSSALIALDNHFFDPEKIIQTSKKFNSREIIEQYEKTLLSVK